MVLVNNANISRFAPTHLRGRMLTLVFSCQPLGQAAASVISIIAAAGFRSKITNPSTIDACTGDCLWAVDIIWRIVIGLDAVPAFIALWFRLTIIESPRYTSEVEQKSTQAAADVAGWYAKQEDVVEMLLPQDTRGHEDETSQALRNHETLDNHKPYQVPDSVVEYVEQLPERPHSDQPTLSDSHAEHPSNEFALGTHHKEAFSSPTVVDPDPPQLNHLASKGDQVLSNHVVPPPPSWTDFKVYFWHHGNIRILLATSTAWFAVDLPFYGLGMNSPRILRTIYTGKPPTSASSTSPQALQYVLEYLYANSYQTLLLVSVGALVGCGVTFFTIDTFGRRNIQINGFSWLFILFIIIGAALNPLLTSHSSSAIIVLYIICQIFFNFGPNTTTYIIPAESFPTRYRGLCYGIAAATGKLGSIVAQVFLAFVNFDGDVDYHEHVGRWLGYSLLIFSSVMALGGWVSWKYIDDVRIRGGDGSKRVKTLEEVAISRHHSG